MKKIISIFTVLMMLASFTVCAAVEYTAYCRFDSQKGGFVVSGTTNDTKIGDEITIEAYLNDTLFDTVITETYKKDDGNIVFESEVMKPNASSESGKMYFKIYSANHALDCKTAEISYCGVDVIYTVLKGISEKMKNGDFDGIKTLLNTKTTDYYNYEIIGVDYSLVSSLSQAVSSTVGEYAKTLDFSVPENAETKENRKIVGEKNKEFAKMYRNMALIGGFADASSSQSFKNWYNEYSNALDLESCDAVKYGYFGENHESEDYFAILSSESKAISDITKIKERLLEAGGLTAVKKGNPSVTKKVIENDFNALMTINYTLTDTQKTSVYTSLSGNSFASFSKLSEQYNILAYNLLNPPQNGGIVSNTPSLGGSTGSGGSSGGNVTFSPVTGGNTNNSGSVFSDMANAKWAETAVNYLYSKGIVSGKTASEFYPNDNVTRAEFVKLLVMASGKEIVKSSQIFADVNSDVWYFDYVNTAYNLGLVKGDEKGNFNPDAQITREDMATMLYRLVGNSENKGDVNVFTDAGNISDYAKSAVAYLNANGVINGMGDGSFAPKSMATRAQSAQIIYNIVK